MFEYGPESQEKWRYPDFQRRWMINARGDVSSFPARPGVVFPLVSCEAGR